MPLQGIPAFLQRAVLGSILLPAHEAWGQALSQTLQDSARAVPGPSGLHVVPACYVAVQKASVGPDAVLSLSH